LAKRLLHFEFYTAAEGLKGVITASPSLWQELAEYGGNWSWSSDDVSLEFRLMGRSEKTIEFSLVGVTAQAGTEDYQPPDEEPPKYQESEGVPGLD
jgi:hypothetical protein